MTSPVSDDALYAALATVNDPEIGKPITDLGMVESVVTSPEGHVTARILLTVSGCPMRQRIESDVVGALRTVEGVTGAAVEFGVMTPEQRTELKTRLRGGAPAHEISFAQPGSLTRVFAVASGKGGVGKSSVTANLAAAFAAQGLKVGVVDADIYGFSIPRMLGVEGSPTQVDDFIMPPVAHGVKVISVGMFVPGNQPVVWRGPMLHRALNQFLADVYWGDLDILLLDLPPGTGDVAISVAQLVPSADIIVVTTPQQAAAEVAERAGSIAAQTHQRVVGVIENMAYFEAPDGSRHAIFGEGGGQAVADSLGRVLGTTVPLLGSIPLEQAVRECGDVGVPIAIAHPESRAGAELLRVASQLSQRGSSLAGKKLGLSPVAR